ncbi:MAG: hypothetical protein GY715_21595 [Planctomycetes bacterium]|nr:hypothetical protein [Planctomycetota bacterium]
MVTRSSHEPDPAPVDLGDALRRLYEPETTVPADVDRSLRAAFDEHFAAQPVVTTIRWWTRPAAIAAIVLVGLAVWAVVPRTAPHARIPTAIVDRADVDRSGKVDILDAFDLARGLQAGLALDPALHDVNTDGVVDARDVDVIACRAVSIGVRLEGGVGG